MAKQRSEATLAALDAKVEERHRENQRWQSATALALAEMDRKLDSLLASRSFTKGIWKAVTIIALTVSALGTLAMSWFTRGH